MYLLSGAMSQVYSLLISLQQVLESEDTCYWALSVSRPTFKSTSFVIFQKRQLDLLGRDHGLFARPERHL